MWRIFTSSLAQVSTSRDDSLKTIVTKLRAGCRPVKITVVGGNGDEDEDMSDQCRTQLENIDDKDSSEESEGRDFDLAGSLQLPSCVEDSQAERIIS